MGCENQKWIEEETGLGTHVATGERVAVKILEKARIVTQADAERVTREIRWGWGISWRAVEQWLWL